MKFDEEQLLLNIETTLKNLFNTKVAEINTEKNDSITLATINNGAFIMDADDREVNYDPYILYMIIDQTSEGRGPTTSETIVVNIALIHTDNGLDPSVVRRMLRYRRALREVIEENFQKINPCGQCSIESLPLLSFQKASTSIASKVVGINIVTSICN